MMDILTEADIANFSFDVDNVSKRALTKPVHQLISISGKSGTCGSSGTNGTSGIAGRDGSEGCNGGRGGDGKNGSAGQSGQSGTDSQHALITLNGTVENLNMQLKVFQTLYGSSTHSAGINWNLAHSINDVNYNFQLAESKAIILVQAVGSDGGDGGCGGDGGSGGNGGRGGDGRDGTRGSDAYREGISGGRGRPGEPGGNGGCGGNGRNGGPGGDGGNAGDGGHIQVRSTDSRLFMLIELDCRAGIKGKGGCGGKGGSRGVGGAGGDGGSGGSGGTGMLGDYSSSSFGRGTDGKCGSSGSTGKDGSSGSAGRNGSSGNDGHDASYGSIQYAVLDIDGNVIETAPDKYHASINGYTIIDENSDGIYEPDSDFFITNVKWTNNGAMTLPSGSILSFSSTKFISNDINDVSVLPGANINQTFLDSHQFKCHLNIVPHLSINQPYIQPVKITSEINLLDRLFTGSQVSTTLTCQYPIQITNIQIPTFLGPNERAIITVNFKNISARPYGGCQNSAGSIEFIFSAHSLIKILPVNAKYFCQITSNGQGRYKINDEMSPKTTKRINFEFSLDADAFHQLYESLFWSIDLLLRDKLIEKRTNNIRVVPAFKSNVHTDVLLVTNSQTDRVEYLAYSKLFQLFKYSSQTWDIERYGAFHHPKVEWLNTTNLIIFIYSNPQSTFNTIKSQLLVQHMNSSENAGFICIGTCQSSEFDFVLFDYNNLQFIDEKQKTKSEATNHLWSGYGCRQPDPKKLNVKANKLRTDYEKQEDHKFLYQVVYDDTEDARLQHCMTGVYGKKYVYKSTFDYQVGNRLIMVTSESSLLVSSHLPFKLQVQLNTTNQHSESVRSRKHKIGINEMDNTSQFQEDIIQDEIHLNSQFGRLLCAILFYQGFEKSLMIISENSELARCIFTLGSNKFGFSQILVSLAMSIIEREYNRESLEFGSSERLINQAAKMIGKVDNITRRTDHEADQNNWLYLLIQSLYEYIDSKSFICFPCRGFINETKQRHKLQKYLSELLSLSTHKIPKNKGLYRTVQIMRLQKLAKLQFPAADTRENCARRITEIRAWKEKQKNEGNTIINRTNPTISSV